jgi:hypothetical protein
VKELKSLGAVGDLLSAENVVLKMVLAYNKYDFFIILYGIQ